MQDNNTRSNVLIQELSFEKEEGIHPADIRAMLQKQNMSLSELSRINGFHPTAGSRALRTPWPTMEGIIADAIGIPAQKIWPSRYDKKSGKPLKHRPRKRG